MRVYFSPAAILFLAHFTISTPGKGLKKYLLCLKQSFCFAVKIILRGKHNQVSDTSKLKMILIECYCLKWLCISFFFHLMVRKILILLSDRPLTTVRQKAKFCYGGLGAGPHPQEHFPRFSDISVS